MNRKEWLRILASANGAFLVLTGFTAVVSRGEIMSTWLGFAILISGIISVSIPDYLIRKP